MTLRLRPYPEYRDSGLPWLGDIPTHWDVRRNGGLFSQRNETGFEDLPILEVSLKTGVSVRSLDGSSRKQVMSDRSKYKRAARGDLAYNMMRMWQGAVGVAPVDGLVSPAYVVARPYPEAEPRYYDYLFRTADYMAEVDSYSRGIVKDRNRLYWQDFKRMPSAFPPTDEQETIANFLDAMGQRIDRLILAKRRLIELLEEEKRVIIHRAVTRGLDPDVPMKPSGVEWLGEIPVDWKVAPLGRLTLSRCDGPFGSSLKSTHYSNSGVQVVRLQNIGMAEFIDSSTAFIPSEYYSTLGDHSVRGGDLLIAGLGEGTRYPPGRACVAPANIEPAMVKADCFRFRLKLTQLRPEFAALQLSYTAEASAPLLSKGSTRQRINLQTTSFRPIAFPNLTEQERIISCSLRWLKQAKRDFATVQEEIKLLQEYRARLIADVVTGKLDVRGVELPPLEEDEKPPSLATGDTLDGSERDAEIDLDGGVR